MRNQSAFRNSFGDYLARRVSKDKKDVLFRGQFSDPPSASSSSHSSTINLTSNNSQQEENFLYMLETPKSNHSNFSIDSSQFSYSKFKSSKEKSEAEGTQRKRLKKLRELQENECAICLDQITNRCQLECRHRFCHDCLLGWLSNTNRCPYCRADVHFYWFKGEKFQVKPKEYEYEQDQQENLDWVCYNCDHTDDGDIVLICDRCEAHACHIGCDQTLHGTEPQGQWYCHFCR